MLLFIDCETTGLPDFNKRARDPAQPHIVSFAAVGFDTTGKELCAFDAIAKPDGWDIPEEVSRIHGITNEIAEREGIPELDIAARALGLIRHCQLLVAHNVMFDKFITRCALRRYDLMTDGDDPWWKALPTFCTMRSMEHVCKLPGNYGKYKWPKLGEAYFHAFGRENQGAHSSTADVRACAEVYFWLTAQGLFEVGVSQRREVRA